MFSQASVILSTIGLMDTRSLVILVGHSVTESVHILLECFFVLHVYYKLINTSKKQEASLFPQTFWGNTGFPSITDAQSKGTVSVLNYIIFW